MYDFDKHFSALSKQTVLCVGDLMLDEFVYGDVSRISPEAPTPVIAVKRTELMIGGAGNVARNLVALGARCIFVGAVGDDEAGGGADQGAWHSSTDRISSGDRRQTADDPKGSLRVGAPFDTSVARRLGNSRQPSMPAAKMRSSGTSSRR